MITEFDIVFDNICEDVHPKITLHIKDNLPPHNEGYVDIHAVLKFLENVEGYDSDMSMRIWDSYQMMNQKTINNLLNSSDANVLSTSTIKEASA